MMLNYSVLSSWGIPGNPVKIEKNGFYSDVYMSFADSVTLNKVKARKSDIERVLDRPIEIITKDGSIVLRLTNDERPAESLFDYLTVETLQNDLNYELPIAIGQDENGKRIYFDLAKAPHILAGGSTGSGKSVFLNNCIMSLIYGARCGLCLIDVKRVEFSIYDRISNLCSPIAYDVKSAKNLLKNLCATMDKRYEQMQSIGVRSITEYNNKSSDQMQYIAIVVDEFADLIMQDKSIEPLLIRIAQLGRAAGLHLILATQRPDSKIISGLIRSNVPTRVCFAVQKATDSRIILDESGGEKLKGRGDGLFKPIGSKNAVRFQAPYISTEELTRIISHVKHL